MACTCSAHREPSATTSSKGSRGRSCWGSGWRRRSSPWPSRTTDRLTTQRPPGRRLERPRPAETRLMERYDCSNEGYPIGHPAVGDRARRGRPAPGRLVHRGLAGLHLGPRDEDPGRRLPRTADLARREFSVAAGTGREPRRAVECTRPQRVHAEGELASHRLRLVRALLVEHRRPVVAQALLRERGQVARPARSASSRARPGGTTRLTRPIRSASSAGTGRPVRIRSIARLLPISRGRRTVPPSMSGTPHRRQNTPKTASSAATRRSHQSASSRPPATAYPSIAAITGFDSRSRVGSHRPVALGVDPVVHRLEVGARAERPARRRTARRPWRRRRPRTPETPRPVPRPSPGRRRCAPRVARGSTVVTGPLCSVRTLMRRP